MTAGSLATATTGLAALVCCLWLLVRWFREPGRLTPGQAVRRTSLLASLLLFAVFVAAEPVALLLGIIIVPMFFGFGLCALEFVGLPAYYYTLERFGRGSWTGVGVTLFFFALVGALGGLWIVKGEFFDGAPVGPLAAIVALTAGFGVVAGAIWSAFAARID